MVRSRVIAFVALGAIAAASSFGPTAFARGMGGMGGHG